MNFLLYQIVRNAWACGLSKAECQGMFMFEKNQVIAGTLWDWLDNRLVDCLIVNNDP